MKGPLVSIIITTKNSARTLEALLKSIKTQTYKNIETIIVDSVYSTDNTSEIAGKYTNKVFSKGPERSAQRNFGASKSQGKYLLFLDSDMVLTKDIVKSLVKKIEEDGNLGGLVIPEQSFGTGFWVKAKALERKINEGQSYFEAARFFPRKIFLEVGGYDETLTGPEDWELPERITKKYSLGRIKNYILHNEGKHTLLSLARRKYYYGLSAHKYLQKHHKSPINPRTVYFLRKAFYFNWQEMFKNPILYFGMWLMLLTETVGGGLGYLVGRLKNAK